jgi:hypothetical protein
MIVASLGSWFNTPDRPSRECAPHGLTHFFPIGVGLDNPFMVLGNGAGVIVSLSQSLPLVGTKAGKTPLVLNLHRSAPSHGQNPTLRACDGHSVSGQLLS